MRHQTRDGSLALYGAMHLVLAIIAAREGDRTTARRCIADARTIAQRLGGDRNDYNTEFGPTNLELHAVASPLNGKRASSSTSHEPTPSAATSATPPTPSSPPRNSRPNTSTDTTKPAKPSVTSSTSPTGGPHRNCVT
jgi:hypothetical protein